MKRTGKMEGQRRAFSSTASNQKASKTESERDSGFSDASSGYFSAVEQTESVDVGGVKSAIQDPQTCSQVAVMSGSYPGLSPMIIMNNIVVKQPSALAPALKPWGFTSSLEMVPQSPLVLFQPVVSSGKCTSKSASGKHQRSKRYSPILKSFPKIAPYPNQECGDLGLNAKEKNSSYASHKGRHQRCYHEDKPSDYQSVSQGLTETTSSDLSTDPQIAAWENLYDSISDIESENSQTKPADVLELSAPRSTSITLPLDSHSSSSLRPEDSPEKKDDKDDDVENCPEALSPSCSKRKRFCNTYNILNRSGLLGITLRTKELIRQNKRSQAQIQELQAQTELFLEAMNSGDPQIWARLQLTLQTPTSKEAEGHTRENSATGVDKLV
ncbi:CLOCK-interacting pacemaker a [Chanos chanos]|uniref:CLOCK-interacting pacemaker a n=1 Tax=Chanos chanos TaxID=29144 RepID=A0A6J2WF67_CHACN|nr:CLOCK-interacting pacemaker [Chanos chanos]